MLSLCLLTASWVAVLPAERFTLAWEHTIEKILWEEDYRLVGSWLYLSGARIRGSGAGMEPPEGAVLQGGAWHYRSAQRWHRALTLARSEFGSDYRLCLETAEAVKRCGELSRWIPAGSGPVTLQACHGPDTP